MGNAWCRRRQKTSKRQTQLQRLTKHRDKLHRNIQQLESHIQRAEALDSANQYTSIQELKNKRDIATKLHRVVVDRIIALDACPDLVQDMQGAVADVEKISFSVTNDTDDFRGLKDTLAVLAKEESQFDSADPEYTTSTVRVPSTEASVTEGTSLLDTAPSVPTKPSTTPGGRSFSAVFDLV